MQHIVLFETIAQHQAFLPLTQTRAIADLRMGILRFREKWQHYFPQAAVQIYTPVPHLQPLYPCTLGASVWLIKANLLPDAALVEAIARLPLHTALVQDGQLLALRCPADKAQAFLQGRLRAEEQAVQYYDKPILQVEQLWDLFQRNGQALALDFEQLTKGRTSAPLCPSNRVLGDPSLLFLEPGAKAQASIFNTQTGPIYLGKDSEVMEGCLVRGGLALCEGAGLKMGAKIYGSTTIGPHSKVGGEVNNSVILGYSNKGHEGFLGNSVLGEWCNLGADTNNSNLKNTYDVVDVWDYAQGRYRSTGLQFCGLFMGDHAKTGINTMLNTGTVLGVAANVFGGGFPPKFVPDFSWGGAEGLTTHRLDKALQTAKAVMARRNTPLTEAAQNLLQAVYQGTKPYRFWESQAQIQVLPHEEPSKTKKKSSSSKTRSKKGTEGSEK